MRAGLGGGGVVAIRAIFRATENSRMCVYRHYLGVLMRSHDWGITRSPMSHPSTTFCWRDCLKCGHPKGERLPRFYI